MASPPQSLTTLLARLAASRTDFLLVGGLAAVAHTTLDVDVVTGATSTTSSGCWPSSRRWMLATGGVLQARCSGRRGRRWSARATSCC